MSDATISLLILGAVILVFVWNRLPVGVVAIFTALSLWATGVLTLDDALAGFGDPVVIFIATLFVVSEGIDSTGVTAWAGQAIIDKTGDGFVRVMCAVMLLCAVLTALISLNGSVAALLPMVVVLARRIGQPPSQMLMPMAFAGSAGSLLVLTGSPVNVIVSEASQDAGGGGFSFFAFTVMGVPLLIVTIVLCLTLGRRVLPNRVSKSLPPDLSQHAATLSQHYALDDGLYRLRVRGGSPLIGTIPGDVDLGAYRGVTLIGLQAGTEDPNPVRHQVDENDVLVVTGPPEQISHLVVDQVLAVGMKRLPGEGEVDLLNRELGVIEVVIPPRSPLVGETVFPGMLRGPDLVILAVQRLGRDRGPVNTELAVGDAMLIHGTWPAIDALVDDRDILIVDSPDLVRRQAVPLGPKAIRAIAVLTSMIVLLAVGLVPPAVAGLLAASAMVLLRVVGVEQAYRSVSWGTVVLVGGLIPLSTALQQSGAAEQIANVIINLVGDGRPLLLMLALFALTGVLGQIISNTATTLIVVPIAVSAALETGVSVQPILMLIAVAGSASFLTPIATPANMMVMAPSGYRFGDYWKLGLPIMAAWLVLSLVIIPLVWPF